MLIVGWSKIEVHVHVHVDIVCLAEFLGLKVCSRR